MTFHKINDSLKILVEKDLFILFFTNTSFQIEGQLPIDIVNIDISIVLNDFFDKSSTFENIYTSLKNWADGAYEGKEIPSALALNILEKLHGIEHPTAINLLKSLIIDEFNSGDVSRLKFIHNNHYLQYLSDKEMEELIRKNYSSPKTKIEIRRLIQEIIAVQLQKQFSDKEMSFSIRGGYYDRFIDGLEIYSKNFNPIKNSGDIFGLEFLSQLTHIHLDNFLTVNIKKLEKLEKVISISITRCRLTEIPDFSRLEKLENLISISITSCRLTEIPDFSKFGKLKTLELNANRLKEINIKGLKELEELHLGQNNISKINCVLDLKNLRKLYLGENRIKRLENLNGLLNLEELDLGFNKIENLEGLDGLINLKRIDLRVNKLNFIRGGIPLNIEDLLLSGNHIQEIEGLGALKNLRTLHIDDNNLTEKRKLELKKKYSNLNLKV